MALEMVDVVMEAVIASCRCRRAVFLAGTIWLREWPCSLARAVVLEVVDVVMETVMASCRWLVSPGRWPDHAPHAWRDQ